MQEHSRESTYNCSKCWDEFGGKYDEKYRIKCPCILSFGNPVGKPILIVCMNPASDAYCYEGSNPGDGQLIDRNNPKLEQENYFEKKKFRPFFDKLWTLFKGPDQPLKDAIFGGTWYKYPWDKVAVVDVVKCPTKETWTKINDNKLKTAMLKNCRPYLEQQINDKNLKIIIAYGSSACEYFTDYAKDIPYWDVIKSKLNDKVNVILIPQAQSTPFRKPERFWFQNTILELLGSEKRIDIKDIKHTFEIDLYTSS